MSRWGKEGSNPEISRWADLHEISRARGGSYRSTALRLTFDRRAFPRSGLPVPPFHVVQGHDEERREEEGHRRAAAAPVGVPAIAIAKKKKEG